MRQGIFVVYLGLFLVSNRGVHAQDFNEESLTEALNQLQDGVPAVRAQAADTLGRRGASFRERVVPALRRHLREDLDWRVRASSGRALGRLGARDAVPDLIYGLRDAVVDVRVVSAAAIWRLPDPAAVQPLVELLEDTEASARQWAVLALGVIRDRRATIPLMARLDDSEPTVRMDVIRSLGRIRDPAALEALEGVAADDERAADERLEAVDAVTNVDGPNKVNSLIRLINASNREVRMRAIVGLGQVGDALAVPALRRRRENEGLPGHRRAIDRAIQAVQTRLEEGQSGDGATTTGVPLNLPPLPQ